MPAQKTPSFASPAHARFAKVFSFAGCSRLLVLSYTVRDAKGVIRWRALIFPPGHPALALALFYQIWPCPCKCPNGHKNGICVCFYPKSAISCRDCPMNPPKSLCTPPTKSYKFVSANPCKTDAGRINKCYYTGCVGGSFWNFIRFRDFPETLRDAKASHFGRGVCGADGEGKDADKKQKNTAIQALFVRDIVSLRFRVLFCRACPLRRWRASSPKGRALGKEVSFSMKSICVCWKTSRNAKASHFGRGGTAKP